MYALYKNGSLLQIKNTLSAPAYNLGSSGYFLKSSSGFTFNNITTWCIEGWINLTSINQYASILDFRPGSATNSFVVSINSNLNLGIGSSNGGGPSYYSTPKVILNQWTHFAIQKIGVNTLQIWLNGVMTDLNIIDPNIWQTGLQNSNGLGIGGFVDPGMSDSRFHFNGMVSQLKKYLNQ